MKRIRVLGESFDSPEELRVHVAATARRLAETPENPVGPRRELEERLAVLRAVERRLRRDRRLRLVAELGLGAGGLAVAYWKAPRTVRYWLAIAAAALVGVVVVYWYVFAAAGLAYGLWRIRLAKGARA